tara:strand:- start:1148 stop:1306 length:159 start_codon:yes stop_codon:yes gene_type:complete
MDDCYYKNKKYDELSEKTKIYIAAIEDFLEFPIDIISNGPGREQNVFKNKIL